MVRPRIDLEGEDKERVEQFAEENGLRMSRAYADLIRIGLDTEGVDE